MSEKEMTEVTEPSIAPAEVTEVTAAPPTTPASAEAGIKRPAKTPAAGPVTNPVQAIALEDIIRNVNQPRKHFDDASIEALAGSIRTVGLVQPIIVTTKGEDGKHVIIAGERRFRAVSSIKGRKTIEAIVREVTPEQIYNMSATENLTREDMTPYETAMVYKTLTEQGKNQGQIAVMFGVSRPVINNYIGLLDLPREIVDELGKAEGSRRIEMSHAKALKAIADQPEVVMALYTRIITENLPAKWAEEQVAEAKRKLAAQQDAASVAAGVTQAPTTVNRQPGGAAAGNTPNAVSADGAGGGTAGTTTPVAPAPEVKLPEGLQVAQDLLKRAIGNETKIRPGTQPGELLVVVGPLFGPMDVARLMKKLGIDEAAVNAVKNVTL